MPKKSGRRKGKQPFPLRQLLRLKGWSQRQLSLSTGISPRRLSDLAHGRHSPTWVTVLRIATAMGLDLGELQPRREGAA